MLSCAGPSPDLRAGDLAVLKHVLSGRAREQAPSVHKAPEIGGDGHIGRSRDNAGSKIAFGFGDIGQDFAKSCLGSLLLTAWYLKRIWNSHGCWMKATFRIGLKRGLCDQGAHFCFMGRAQARKGLPLLPLWYTYGLPQGINLSGSHQAGMVVFMSLKR